MAQPKGSIQRPGYGSRVPAEPARNAPRADPLAAAILLIAGAIGLWQLLLPWRSAGIDIPNVGEGQASATGWQVYRLLHAVPDPTVDIRVAMYAVLGVAVGGGALILLGLAMMLPINHRPLGLAALLISVLSILGGCWILVRSKTVFDVGIFGLFSQAQLGWYLFLAAGIVGVFGSWKALATG
jgi:hypothetical protein